MKKIIILLVIFVATIATSVNAQISYVSVGDKTTEEINRQIGLLDQQISLTETKKAAEITLVNKWKESVDTVSEDNFDAEILLAKIDSTYNTRIAAINAKYDPQIELLNQFKLQLLGSMASTSNQNYLKGSGSAKKMSILYATGQIYTPNTYNGNSSSSANAINGCGIVANAKNTAVNVKIICKEQSILSQEFSLLAGESREFPAMPGLTYTFIYTPQSGAQVMVTKLAFENGTFEHNGKRYIVGSKCFDKNIGGSYY